MAASSCHVAPTVQLGNSWAGNDGNWSTFAIAVGTPPQNFSVLPALTSGETWVPSGCVSPTQACAASRGVGATTGPQSMGFQANVSSSWDLIGLYQLSYEGNLFGQDNTGLYGQDTIDLGQSAGDAFKVVDQTVAGVQGPEFWLGSFGLGVSPSAFAGRSGAYPSLLSSMKSQGLTPSASFAYSAGASYRNSSGSLIFGGYDHALFDSDSISYELLSTNDTALGVRLQNLAVTNSPTSTFSLNITAGGVRLALDSSTSQLWLPEAWCDTFQENLSLKYDNTTDLYTINSTVANQAINSGTQLTFTLASEGGKTTNIVFPISAFLLEAGYPIYPDETLYFPIRRAANETQYVLGRAFMQEAYIVVDWERGNLTIGQASHSTPDSVTPLCPPTAAAGHPGLSPGAIAGIAIGAVLGVALLCAAAWSLWAMRRRRAAAAAAAAGPERRVAELEGAEQSKAELMSTHLHEMHEPEQQLMSTPVYELPAPVHELAGSPTVAELPGGEKR